MATPLRSNSLSSRVTDDPFATQPESLNVIDSSSEPNSVRSRDTARFNRPRNEKFVSYRLVGEYPRPWLQDKKMKRMNRGNIIIWVMCVIGLGLSGYICYDGYKTVKINDYCLILDDSFSTLDSSTWSHEIIMQGTGTGSFDWTTDNRKITYTDSKGLHIVPQLTTEAINLSEEQLLNGHTVNLTRSGGDGTCTQADQDPAKCSARSNSTTGEIIPPVMSARLTTKGKKKIRYGKVEVTARMPKGDWLWPAIWMMPEADKYGEWPRSGEIDIAEVRGNDWRYPQGGNDVFTSVLHWGPDIKNNNYWRTIYGRKLRRTDFSSGYHTFGLEWSENYLFTYIDSRLQQVLQVYFKDQNMWQRGYLGGLVNKNDTFYVDPWSSTGRKNTPFDEEFYLILNVAVGSRNGWFLDGSGNKPWVDANPSAPLDFWKARDKWLPTWGKGDKHGMNVKRVKMWQEGKCKA